MYKITTRDGAVLYDVSYPDTYMVTEPKATLEVGQPGSVQFSLVPEHPLYGTVKTMETYVCALKENTEFFYGRIIDINVDQTTGIKQIECAGALQFLEDAEIPPVRNQNAQQGEEQGVEMTASEFFSMCISAFNADIQNDAKRTLSVGTISHSKASATKLYNIGNYTQVKSALDSNLISEYGGYFRIRKSGNNHLIDWLEDYGESHASPIQIAENVISQENAISANDFYTLVRPIGKDNLMLPEVTVPILGSLVSKYGRIIRTVTFGDAETEADLRAKTDEYISMIGKGLGQTATIKVVDLHFLDNSIPAIRLASTYTNLSGFQGEEMVAAGMELHFANPADDTVTFKNKKELIASQKGGTTGRGALSKVTEQGRSGPQGFQNVWQHITETEDSLSLHAELISINAERLVETAVEFERLSRETQDALGNITGTGVFQNNDHITQVAGCFSVRYYPVPSTKLTPEVNPSAKHWYVCSPHPVTEADVNSGKEFFESPGAATTGQALNTAGLVVGSTVYEMHFTSDTSPVSGVKYYTKGVSLAGAGADLTVEEDGVPITVAEKIISNTDDVETIQGSALWTMKDHITGVCGDFKIEIDPSTGERRLVIKSGGGIRILRNSTEFGLFDEDNLTAGILVGKINDPNNPNKVLGTKVDITADQVNVGSTSNVAAWMDSKDIDINNLRGLIADKATIYDVEAYLISSHFVSSELAKIDNIAVNSISASNNVICSGEIRGATVNGATALSIANNAFSNVIVSASVSGDGKTLTLTPLTGNPVTFNKAASQSVSLSGAWSGGSFTVTTNPNVGSISTHLTNTGHWGSSGSGEDPNHYYYTTYATINSSGTPYNTGNTTEIDASARYNAGRSSVTITDISVYGSPSASATSISVKATASNGQSDIEGIDITTQRNDAYNTGVTYGYGQGDPISGTAGSLVAQKVHNFSINRRTGSPSTIQIDCSSIYAAARSGYTLGTFTQATVTLQGSSVSVKPISTTSVRLGTKGTYYKGDGGSFTVQGASATAYKKLDSGGNLYYKAGTATTYYNAGSQATYYNAGVTTVEARGGSVTVTPIGNSYSFQYLQTYDSTGKSQGYRWVGTSGRTTLYAAGSDVTYYRGNGGTKTVQGSAVTVTKQGSSVSVTPINSSAKVRIGSAVTLYEKGTVTKNDRGDSVSGYPVVSSGGNVYYLAGAAQTYYEKGTTDSDNYWTKS